MLLADRAGRHLKARFVGSRANKTVDLIVDLPATGADKSCELQLTPVQLPAPKLLKDAALWRTVRRAWLNVFQPSAQWGDQGNPFSAPAGILANNVISDPVSCLISLYGDAALLMPEIAPGISVAPLVRRTVDWWLDARTRPSGEVVAYWNHGDMLDANASPLIAAWDYVEATRDTDWLKKRIARLEVIADYLAQRDTDDDGLVESTHSGKAGTLLQQMLGRQVRGVFPNGGGFQNGVVDRIPDGAEFYTWDGKPCGYEGYLTYSFSFLQAVLLREPALRARYYRPLSVP